MFVSVFAFAFAISAVAASACWWCGSSVDVDNYNSVGVTNDVDAYANTGYNGGCAADINTGSASATATAYVDVNHNYTEVDNAPYWGGVAVSSINSMNVTNDVDANANTGHNNGGWLASVNTGNAYAGARTDTLGNTNYTEVNAPYMGKVYVNNSNRACVGNYVDANANTGHNGGWLVEIETGDATSVANSFTVVNSNVTKVGL